MLQGRKKKSLGPCWEQTRFLDRPIRKADTASTEIPRRYIGVKSLRVDVYQYIKRDDMPVQHCVIVRSRSEKTHVRASACEGVTGPPHHLTQRDAR